jgi:ribosomal protein S27E
MPIEVDCPCGQRFSVSEALAGFSVHCRGCGSSVAVPRPGDSALVSSVAKQQAAARVAAPPSPAPSPPTAPRAAELKGASSSYDSAPPSSEPQEKEGTFNGGVIGGLGLILVAAIWFIVGLALGRIFFYPIIMFVIGIGTLFKSMVKGKWSGAAEFACIANVVD